VLDGKSANEVRSLIQTIATGEPPLTQAGKIWSILTLLLKQDGGFYRTMASEAAETIVAIEREALARARDEILPFVDVVFGGADSRHGELLTYSRTLVAVAQQCLERYAAKKEERGKLDFEDLQLHLRALLHKEDIRTHLASRFKFIMVDEYQDTNELQYELLRPLLLDLRAGNLFIVGDPKQSIYSFRGADVAVFDRTCRDLAAANGPAAATGQIVLEESFRPLRDLAAFVNLVFQPLMGREGRGESEYEVEYEPIVRSRQNRAPGRVELLLSGPSERAEPERVAGAIQELMESGYAVYDGSESPHRVRFADIAILLRSRVPLPELELALARTGIPYVVTGGVGYFQTQDILDFHSYLRFLQNDGDDVALLGILRSPFFTISDVELFEAVVRGRRDTLWQDLLTQRKRGLLAPRLAGALALLQEDLVVCSRLSAPDVLSRIISRTRYQAKIAGTPRAAQSAANLEKLRHMADAFDLQGFTTLFDFTLRLRQLIEEEEGEGQGNIDTQTDEVQIMTVHAAKGLEFPVVVLPFLHRTFRYDNEPFLHEHLGLGCARTGEEGDAEDFPLTAFLRKDARRKTIAEEKRIFYVACTRARDALLLSADATGRRSGTSWMGWLLEGLGVPGETPGESLTFECTTRTLERGEGEYRAGAERHRLTVGVRFPSPTKAAGTTLRAAVSAAEPPMMFADPIPARDAGEIFSATRIRVYRDCPAHYYLRYVLGMPQEGFVARGGEADELVDAEFPPDLRGRIFHGTMESIDRLTLSDLPSEIRRLLAIEVAPSNPHFAQLAEEVQGMITGVISSPFWHQVAGGTNARTEFTISAVLGDDFLSGTIDRVYRGSDGHWHVLDYKTDRVDSSTVTGRAEEYWPQLEFYAHLVHLFFDCAPVMAELLFAAMPHHVLRREYSLEALADARAEIATVIARIKANTFPPRPTSCPRCPFASGCPWNRHEQ
jgi:ATP-dependent helicase/nuclease subunit A